MPRYTYRRNDTIRHWAGNIVREWDAFDTRGNYVWRYRLDFAPYSRMYWAYRNPPGDTSVGYYRRAKPRLLALLTDEDIAADYAAAVAHARGQDIPS